MQPVLQGRFKGCQIVEHFAMQVGVGCQVTDEGYRGGWMPQVAVCNHKDEHREELVRT